MFRGRPLQLSGPMAPLADSLGGETALCEALGGVAASTVYRWDKGLHMPHKPARQLIADIARANGLPVPTWPKRERKVSPKAPKP